MNHLRDNLIMLRARSNKTQWKTAKEMGISNRNIANYEAGKNLPTLDSAVRIAEYYNVTIDDLLRKQL